MQQSLDTCSMMHACMMHEVGVRCHENGWFWTDGGGGSGRTGGLPALLVEEDSQGVAAPSGNGLTLPSCQEQTLVLDCSGPMERERVASSAASSAGCAAAPVLVRTTTKRGLLGCSLRSCRMRWPLGSLQPPRRSVRGRAQV